MLKNLRYLWNQTIKSLVLICSLCLLSCQHNNQNTTVKNQNEFAKTSYVKGVSLFKKEKLKSARSIFENVNKGNKYFVPTLLEIQKINYIEGNWNRFFGIASYYRSVLLNSKSSAKKYFQQELLALEVLALIRHCRFNLAYQVVEYSLSIGQKVNKNTLKIRQAGYFFKLKELVADKKLKRKRANLIELMNFWPLKQEQLPWVDNPKNLRVKVKSEC